MEGQVSLTVANFVTLSGAFGFQTNTVVTSSTVSDTYLSMGMVGNINVTAGSTTLGLAGASIGVLVDDHTANGTSTTTYAVQASEGSNSADTTFNGPARRLTSAPRICSCW